MGSTKQPGSRKGSPGITPDAMVEQPLLQAAPPAGLRAAIPGERSGASLRLAMASASSRTTRGDLAEVRHGAMVSATAFSPQPCSTPGFQQAGNLTDDTRAGGQGIAGLHPWCAVVVPGAAPLNAGHVAQDRLLLNLQPQASAAADSSQDWQAQPGDKGRVALGGEALA